MSDLLLNLCSKSHSQEQIVGTSTYQRNESKRQKLIENPDVKEENYKFQTSRRTTAEDFYDERRGLLEGDFFSQSAISEMEVPDKTNEIAKAFNAAFTNCKGFLLSPKATKAHGAGRQLSKGVYKKEMQETENDMNRMLNNESNNTKAWLPGPRSQEVEGVQPIFAWMLDKILAVLRTQDKNEKPIRFGDYAVTKEGCSLTIYPPDCGPTIMELKPFFRAGAGHPKVMHGGTQQGVSHISKFLSVCFNWSGPGIDSFGTGVLATLAYVRVVRVELVRVGTDECNVRLLESKCFPLLHKVNFERWLNSNGPTGSDEHEIKSLTEELYPAGYSEDQIPCGFKAL